MARGNYLIAGRINWDQGNFNYDNTIKHVGRYAFAAQFQPVDLTTELIGRTITRERI